MIGIALLIILILLLVGALPAWPYAADWGYLPSSLLLIVIIVLVALLVMRRGP